MRKPIHVLDAFTGERFAGNPAAVVLFDEYPDDGLLQAIAAENNLSETAFPVPGSDGHWELRWFTPTIEVPLCGHATLASAHVLFSHVLQDASEIVFTTRQSGALVARRSGDAIILDFPASSSETVDDDLSGLFGFPPSQVRKCDAFAMAVLDSADMVRGFKPDRAGILALDRGGLIVTAPGDRGYDCVSRFFAPASGIDEDPVTGGAHTMLAPYWAARLGKREIRAFQASPRGGEMLCRFNGERVELEGRCVPYLAGTIEV